MKLIVPTGKSYVSATIYVRDTQMGFIQFLDRLKPKVGNGNTEFVLPELLPGSTSVIWIASKLNFWCHSEEVLAVDVDLHCDQDRNTRLPQKSRGIYKFARFDGITRGHDILEWSRGAVFECLCVRAASMYR